MSEKIALVHDYLLDMGGAEMTLKALSETWPEAPIYTLLHNRDKFSPKFLPAKEIHSSFVERLPAFIKKRKKFLLPFLAVAPETFDLRDFDVVLASSGAFSKGVITKPNTLSICYCHSPMRFAWDYTHQYLGELSTGHLRDIGARIVLNYLRLWDFSAAQRPDYLIANSKATAQKLQKYYHRKAPVIYPPVEVRKIQTAPSQSPEKFFLIVSRLSAYKKIDVAVEAFNKLGWPLVIIGTGSEEKKLKRLAKDNIQFLGCQSRKKVIEKYQQCRAYLLPGEEDFGIAPVEAMAAGKPVLALRRGGATETVKEGITGEFFTEPLVEVLAEGAYRLNQKIKEGAYNSQTIKEHAAQFSKENFQKEIQTFIQEKLAAHQITQ